MELDRECRMIVYMGTAEFAVTCRPKQRLGHRISAILSGTVPVGSVVKIEYEDDLVFGEVWACWSNDEGVNAVLQLNEILGNYREIAARSGI